VLVISNWSCISVQKSVRYKAITSAVTLVIAYTSCSPMADSAVDTWGHDPPAQYLLYEYHSVNNTVIISNADLVHTFI
jgi:hypothetical protein